MAEKFVGNTTVQELQPALELDPIYGSKKIRRFEGPHSDLEAMAQQFLAAGYNVTVDPVQGTWSRMYVRSPNTTEGVPGPVDTWERTTELVQEDIRNNPQLIAALTAALPDALKSGAVNAFYKDFKDKIKAGTQTSYGDPAQQAFFDLLSRGADAYLVRRIVVRRRRVLATVVPGESAVHEVEKFYSTAALIDVFGVPNGVAGKLPVAGPTTPSNTAWGWIERMDTSLVTPAYGQTEEVKDWVFAAWSTLLYSYVP